MAVRSCSFPHLPPADPFRDSLEHIAIISAAPSAAPSWNGDASSSPLGQAIAAHFASVSSKADEASARSSLSSPPASSDEAGGAEGEKMKKILYTVALQAPPLAMPFRT